MYWRRKELNLYKKDVAKMIGKSVSSIRRYEIGVSIPSERVLKKISSVLKVEFLTY
jgi:transcriptional regulator with XRE-family HTH domain